MSIGQDLKKHVQSLGNKYVTKQKRKIEKVSSMPTSAYSVLQYELNEIGGEISIQEADAKIKVTEAKEEYVETVESQYTPEQLESGARNLVDMKGKITELDKQSQGMVDEFLDAGSRQVDDTRLNIGDAADFKAKFDEVFELRIPDPFAKEAIDVAKELPEHGDAKAGENVA